MTRRSTSVAAVLFALTMLTPSEPAVADWLVTSDGTRIETQGPWEVRDGMVVFSRGDGSLASMRLSDVDVDASGSEPPSEPGRPAAGPKPATPEPILVLTNRDVPRAQTESLPPAAGRGADPDLGDRRGKRLKVTAWTVVENDAGEAVEVVGRLSNVGQRPAKRLGLVLILLDRRGEEVESGRAHLDDTDLRPGESTLFQLPLETPTEFTAVKFRSHGKLL